jgi:hypothetical protein
MIEPSPFARDDHRRLWAAIGQTPSPIYLLVGERQRAQAHLFGSFALERKDGEDLIVLQGTEVHLHVNWPAITRVERAQRDGFDTIRFLGGAAAPVLELLTDAGTPFPPDVVELIPTPGSG